MTYTIYDFNEAVDNFNKSSVDFIIYLPTYESIYNEVVKYTNHIKEYTYDSQRYESLKKFGCIDDNLFTEIGLFVLQINKITRPNDDAYDISCLNT